jgi:hypothetical protein
MNRRQFLFTSFVSGIGLVMPNVDTATVKNYAHPIAVIRSQVLIIFSSSK